MRTVITWLVPSDRSVRSPLRSALWTCAVSVIGRYAAHAKARAARRAASWRRLEAPRARPPGPSAGRDALSAVLNGLPGGRWAPLRPPQLPGVPNACFDFILFLVPFFLLSGFSSLSPEPSRSEHGVHTCDCVRRDAPGRSRGTVVSVFPVGCFPRFAHLLSCPSASGSGSPRVGTAGLQTPRPSPAAWLGADRSATPGLQVFP